MNDYVINVQYAKGCPVKTYLFGLHDTSSEYWNLNTNNFSIIHANPMTYD